MGSLAPETNRINMSPEEEAAWVRDHPNAPDRIGSRDPIYREAVGRRGLIKRGLGLEVLGKRGDGKAGFEDLAPDVADMVFRDLNGRARNARKGSTGDALGLARAFDPNRPLGRDTQLGEF